MNHARSGCELDVHGDRAALYWVWSVLESQPWRELTVVRPLPLAEMKRDHTQFSNGRLGKVWKLAGCWGIRNLKNGERTAFCLVGRANQSARNIDGCSVGLPVPRPAMGEIGGVERATMRNGKRGRRRRGRCGNHVLWAGSSMRVPVPVWIEGRGAK
uniref:Uncharacterized protein n=1 Tax=Compsopogon caeruleus TaxID=31354 RepID=A0A7S1T785_9RHOD|mmetsp:Transcript_10325/g.20801  ORF Transcript_10325/g.20801 Transcript_10325/m.20801 type:complete len:157 (+) Transcript_10325:291-761(+)